MSTEIAQRRIESFHGRFGDKILFLAYHAAFPIALTPDLLYRIWANFQQDVHGKALEIPWIAVANLLLSTLVDEVGYELYEMDRAVRSLLLKKLEESPRFGQQRIKELSYFLQAYIEQTFKSQDPYERSFAEAQQVTARAFVAPGRVARELASKLSEYNEQKQDKYELLRLTSLIESLKEPLKDYKALFIYSHGMVNSVLNDKNLAISEFKKLSKIESPSQKESLIVRILQLQKPLPKEVKFEYSTLANLYKYKEYGEAVLREINSLPKNSSSPNEVLDNRELQECLKNLEDAANKTVELASSSVKIAIMGEFSSGKTLLVGSLIGYADALPLSELPTTGNVTAIHLVQQEGFKTTEFDNFTVEYLSHEKVKECVGFMLDEARKRGQASELPPFPKVNSTTLNEETLNLYEKWCESAWNQTQNTDLLSLLRELVIFIRACVSYGGSLCGESLTITHTTAREGLELTSISPVKQSLKFEDIPEVAKLSVNKNQPSPELLQNSFSLIRRVNIYVKISKEIWNLGTTQDAAKFIILDFPGLGAADSGVRDTFVSLQELEKVQTILILLNGKRPGSDNANKIVNMIRQKRPTQNLKDFILVGVGRFNELPIEEQKLNQLIDNSANNPLTEKSIYQELPVLRTIIDQASAFTSKPDRIVLLDQLIGLANLAQVSPSVKVGSQEFLAKLGDQNDISLQQSKRMRDKWQSIGERLLTTDPHSSLGQQLRYFAYDGGIGKLQELIFNHVAAHSLKQLCDETTSAAKKLHKQQNDLKTILSNLGISLEESPALSELRSSIGKMKSTYNSFKNNLAKETLKDARGIPINEVIKDEVTYRILDWKQWNLLFKQAQNGIIVLPATKEDKDNSFARKRKAIDNIPTRSDDFYDVFEQTVNQLQNFARDCIQSAIINLLNNFSNELSREIQYIQGIFSEAMETEIENKIGEEEAEIFSVVYRAYNPEKWQAYITEQTFKDENSIETKTIFPLALKDENHESGQIFDWDIECRQNSSNSDRKHLIQILRLRDKFTTSLSLHLSEYVSQIKKKVDLPILNILNSLAPELDLLLRNEKLLRYIAGEKQEIHEADSVSPVLSKIALIPAPETSS
ncbi:dynamin family protein [Aetokthonos hydrillicola Thurmond2011]|uniref:Dynamin family protein n=1 Tax=Aetokthonos hydrillicola Thurmond2011 TaxID=2712845 RepID=A0AAP5I2F2_9CYAN|nr:dynamin family protein [Aetokthonos hydrillicola]MBO3459361.1 proteasome protein [Aetokthonos hydrillicola CCALA 1050]MDR9893549.1 dynamin family protein [Aetokthonos hydrillicola Thurmond2011]